VLEDVSRWPKRRSARCLHSPSSKPSQDRSSGSSRAASPTSPRAPNNSGPPRLSPLVSVRREIDRLTKAACVVVQFAPASRATSGTAELRPFADGSISDAGLPEVQRVDDGSPGGCRLRISP
jgi:hypothetical protein